MPFIRRRGEETRGPAVIPDRRAFGVAYLDGLGEVRRRSSLADGALTMRGTTVRQDRKRSGFILGLGVAALAAFLVTTFVMGQPRILLLAVAAGWLTLGYLQRERS
ncbi:hypothetical protein FBY41_2942 [Humibacillus xanthopallidus]|uniref:Uncharacterized protein n=1 Tax=Humibacillus xanthopallidus TaxID=412689 RepID=A0A543HX43_9MICO|nr:hypothetical protein FBY41_2942 [Humibacillus xanthopallidus]